MSIFFDEEPDRACYETMSGKRAPSWSIGSVSRYSTWEEMPVTGYVDSYLMDKESVPCLIWLEGQENPVVAIFWQRDEDRSGWRMVVHGRTMTEFDENDVTHWAFLPTVRQ